MNSIDFRGVRERVSLAEFAGRFVTLRGVETKVGVCPICGSGAKKKTTPFQVKGDRWRCWADCDRGGDVIDLYRELEGGSVAEAVAALLGGSLPAPAKPKVNANAVRTEEKDKADIAGETWSAAKPIDGTRVERYLASRGVPQALIEMAAPALRYHPFARHSWDDAARTWIKAPAMLVAVTTPEGPTGGVHATYLQRDGVGRDKRLGKRMWGPQALNGVTGGAWLIGPHGAGRLAEAEGIETTLGLAAVMAARGEPVRAVAALSLGRLQGGWITDSEGRVDPYDIQPDPLRPGFTWPQPACCPWPEVLVGVDRDMSPIRLKGVTQRGKTIEFLLEAEARARLSARLACTSWARSGSRARAIAPPPLTDFGDVAKDRGQAA